MSESAPIIGRAVSSGVVSDDVHSWQDHGSALRSMCGAVTIMRHLVQPATAAGDINCRACLTALGMMDPSPVKTLAAPGEIVDLFASELIFIRNEASKEYSISEMTVDQKAQHIAALHRALAQLKAKAQGWEIAHRSYLDTLSEDERRERVKLDQSYRVHIPKPQTKIDKLAAKAGVDLGKLAKFLEANRDDLFD